MIRRFKKAVILVMALAFVLAMCGTAYAAEAKMSLSGGGTFEKGDTVTITLKYSGATFGSATAVQSLQLWRMDPVQTAFPANSLLKLKK